MGTSSLSPETSVTEEWFFFSKSYSKDEKAAYYRRQIQEVGEVLEQFVSPNFGFGESVVQTTFSNRLLDLGLFNVSISYEKQFANNYSLCEKQSTEFLCSDCSLCKQYLGFICQDELCALEKEKIDRIPLSLMWYYGFKPMPRHLCKGVKAYVGALPSSRAFARQISTASDTGISHQETIRSQHCVDSSLASVVAPLSSKPEAISPQNSSPDGHATIHVPDNAHVRSPTEASPSHTPNISPSTGNTSPDPEGGRVPLPTENAEEESAQTNRSSLIKTFLAIAAQAVFALFTIRYTSNTSLSRNAKILLGYAMTCNVIGFLCCLFGILLSRRKPGVAIRILTGMGYIAIAYGFIAVVGMQMPNSIMLLITFVACIVSFPALFYAIFMKDRLYNPHYRC